MVLNNIDITEPRRIFERVFTFNKKLKYVYSDNTFKTAFTLRSKPFARLINGRRQACYGKWFKERFPFLDNDLVTLAQKIPIRHKLANLEKMKRSMKMNSEIKNGLSENSDGKLF